jgi:hypothetical protein
MSREDRSRSIGDKRSATFAKPTSFEMSIGDFVSIGRPSGRHVRFTVLMCPQRLVKRSVSVVRLVQQPGCHLAILLETCTRCETPAP